LPWLATNSSVSNAKNLLLSFERKQARIPQCGMALVQK
jgi:hypothetical protein